jgi:sulfonate transport system substrate-binding protein
MRRTLAILALAVTAVSGLAACGDDKADAGGLDGVTITVGQSNKLSNHTLLSAAGLDDTPYKIKWADFNATPDMLQAIAAGSVDIGGNGGTTGAIAAVYRGVEVRIAAAAKSTGAGADSSAVIVPKDSAITSFAQLKGKKIGLTFGAGVQYYTVLALKQFGLTTNDVQLVNLTTNAAQAAFRTHKIDAWAVWDPILATAESDLGAKPILAAGQITALGPSYTFQFANPKSLADPAKGAALADFVHRVAQAQLWVNDHPDAWAKAGQQIAGLSPGASALAAKRQAKTYVPIGDPVYQALQQEADTWVALGTYPQKTDVSKGFTTQLNNQVPGAQS